MRFKLSLRVRLALFVSTLVIVLSIAALEPGLKLVLGANERVPLATDWSYRHLVFSAPGSLMERFRLSNDVRYVQQFARRTVLQRQRQSFPWSPTLQGDWNVLLGVNSSGTPATLGAGMYPAKFSFDLTSANCASDTQPDFVIYTTNLAGSTTALPARTIGTFTATPTSGQTLVITNGTQTLTLFASTIQASVFWKVSSTLATDATNLASAIASNGGSVGVTATASGAQVTITATTAGSDGNSITVTNNVTNLSFVFAGTTTNLVNGATGVPTVVAYDNLYDSCSGTAPSTYWAYNTGTGSIVYTSPVLSGDGTQVAFTQYTGTLTQLVLLKWAPNSGTVADPVTPTLVANGGYSSCTAPCYTTLNFSTANGGINSKSTKSSPFYDYFGDALYVGDNAGTLHEFTGVFLGTPAEVISTSGANRWPAVIDSTANTLSSPVYLGGAGEVYVADSLGFLYRVDSTIGAGTGGSVKSADSGSAGFDDGPIVDASTGYIYVFMRGDGGSGANKRAGIYRFTSNFASGSSGTETAVGTNSTLPVTSLFAGTFDNIYYNSSNGTGNMYVCTTAGSAYPTLWRVPVTAGVLGTAVRGPTLTTASATCSPVTEFVNGSTDRIFVSVTAAGKTASPIGCPASSGCIMAFDITSTSGWSTAKTTSASTSVAGGASGVIIDNSSAAGGASQVYYTPLSTTAATCLTANQQGIGGCAIQASQSGLN